MSTIFDNGGQVYFKYELLTLQDGTYKHSRYISDYVEGGSIDIDFDRSVISGANFSLKDIPDIDYLSDLIKPIYCLVTGGTTYEIPLGYYMLLSPSKLLDGKEITREIEGFDLLKALDQNKTLVSQSFVAGTNVVTSIESLLYGIGTWTKYQIEPSTQVLSEDISYELGRSTLFIINSMLNMINYYPIWCTGNGVYKSIPWSDVPNVAHEFLDNSVSLYEENVGLFVDYSDIYNKVVVITNQLEEDTAPLYKVLAMEDDGLSTHPFSYTSIGRHIVKIFNSEAVSQTYVDLRAKRELHKMLEIEESIRYRHAFVTPRLSDGIPWQGDAYRFKNTDLDIDKTYKILNQNYVLKTGLIINSNIKGVVLL